MIADLPDVPAETDMSSLFAAKSALRKSMLKALRQIPEEELRQQCKLSLSDTWARVHGQGASNYFGLESVEDRPDIIADAVFRSLVHQDFYTSARCVGCYLSMASGELQTNKIVDDLLFRGVKLYTPYLPPAPAAPSDHSASPPPGTMQMLRLYSPVDLGNCPLDKWGIVDPGEHRRDSLEKREDALDKTAPDLDVILIPGVAFDEDCNRMGRGKAYYDRYLAQYTSTRKRPLLVALALTPQLLPSGQKVPVTPDDFTLDGVISPDKIFWRAGKEPEKR